MPNSSKVQNTNYLKPNEKPDIDILLFLNPSFMIQCQIDFIWKKKNYPENACFLFGGYHGFEDKEKFGSAIRSQAIKMLPLYV